MTIMTDANTRRRVKLYMLNESRVWDDQGTGHVTPVSAEKVVKSLSLVVKSEVDSKLRLLNNLALILHCLIDSLTTEVCRSLRHQSGKILRFSEIQCLRFSEIRERMATKYAFISAYGITCRSKDP